MQNQSDYLEPSDDCLFNRYKGGDIDAGAMLFSRYYQKLKSAIIIYAKIREDIAEDALQDAFFQLHIYRDKIRDNSKIFSWLLTTARRCAYKILQKEGSYHSKTEEHSSTSVLQIGPLYDHSNLPSETPSPQVWAIDRQVLNIIESGLKNLTEMEKKVFRLRLIERYSTRQVADMLSTHETNITTILSRATQKLRIYLPEGL